jgi:aerobic carbon-monoxide dehydrogenase medium subunit
MLGFDLHHAESVEHTISLLSQYEDAHLLAGGTSLMLLLNLGLIEPSHVVLLRRVAELHGIERLPDGGLEIRALTTHRQAELSPEVQAHCPALSETFRHVATVRIRNQATVGGNLAHADPAQDPPPMLIALDAAVVLRGSGGERTLPVEDFFHGYLTTALQPTEVLTSVRLPPLAKGTRATYEKFLPRSRDDYGTVSVAATLRLDDGQRCADVRIALGGAAPVPLRLRQVEDVLRGQDLSHRRILEAAALVPDLVDPPDDARGSAQYKRRMARVWTERALRKLMEAA